jgi:hypothetical protein
MSRLVKAYLSGNPATKAFENKVNADVGNRFALPERPRSSRRFQHSRVRVGRISPRPIAAFLYLARVPRHIESGRRYHRRPCVDGCQGRLTDKLRLAIARNIALTSSSCKLHARSCRAGLFGRSFWMQCGPIVRLTLAHQARAGRGELPRIGANPEPMVHPRHIAFNERQGLR